MPLGLRLCTSREGGSGGGGWVSALSIGSMAASGLGHEKLLVGAGWAISLLLCTNGLRKQSSRLVARASISGSEAFFSVEKQFIG